MRTTMSILFCAALLAACGSKEDDPGVSADPAPKGSGGKTGSTGSGGSPGTPSGSGGAVAPAGSGGSVGSTGSGGAAPAGGAGGAVTADAATPPTDTTPGTGAGGSSPAPAASGDAPYGCTKCERLFDGKTFANWETTEGAWEIKEGAMASTGKPNDIYTKEDFGDARIFFQVRQIKGNHKPCTTLFGNRPAAGAAPKRGLSGAQFQPPNGAWWDYGAGGAFKRGPNPNFNVANWHQCEVLIKEAGTFRAACCPVGATACKGVEVLSWQGKGKKAPFDIMMHNAGLFDEYREIWVERGAAGDEMLSMK
jgi:hypothetical protein